jgi:hypothetical protein
VETQKAAPFAGKVQFFPRRPNLIKPSGGCQGIYAGLKYLIHSQIIGNNHTLPAALWNQREREFYTLHFMNHSAEMFSFKKRMRPKNQ